MAGKPASLASQSRSKLSRLLFHQEPRLFYFLVLHVLVHSCIHASLANEYIRCLWFPCIIFIRLTTTAGRDGRPVLGQSCQLRVRCSCAEGPSLAIVIPFAPHKQFIKCSYVTQDFGDALNAQVIYPNSSVNTSFPKIW